jgi:hypothetical protein
MRKKSFTRACKDTRGTANRGVIEGSGKPASRFQIAAIFRDNGSKGEFSWGN